MQFGDASSPIRAWDAAILQNGDQLPSGDREPGGSPAVEQLMLARGARLRTERFEFPQRQEAEARKSTLLFHHALHAVIPRYDHFQLGPADLLVQGVEAAIEGGTSIHDRDHHGQAAHRTVSAMRVALAMRVKVRFLAGRKGNPAPSAIIRCSN